MMTAHRSRRAMLRSALSRQLFAFAVVGSIALLLHFLVVSALVPFGLPPLVANVVGFSSAFAVSFGGHDRWSFPSSTGRARSPALRRFLLVAVASFGANESMYWLLLSFTDLDYRVSLVVVLGAVAALTFVLSKHWAFADVRA